MPTFLNLTHFMPFINSLIPYTLQETMSAITAQCLRVVLQFLSLFYQGPNLYFSIL
jgi:hypothetical protein